MTEHGHDVLVTARDKDVTLALLNEYRIEHVTLSTQASGTPGLLTEWTTRTARLGRIARSFKPDVMTGIMGVSIAPVGRLLRIPSVVFYDTEWATRTNRIVYPLATTIVTPDCYSARVRGNHIVYPSYHELAYLHPNRFQADPDVATKAGIDPDSTLSIVRFVSWEASHDVGQTGLTSANKRTLISRLAERGQVLISSEGPLPQDLQSLAYRGPKSNMHHLMATASLVVGESTTMASEAAVLGTPTVCINPARLGYIEELNKRYGLVQRFDQSDFAEASDVAVALLSDVAREDAALARERLLTDKIDLTMWMVEFFARFGNP
jgi:predicted glycosyltransferase